MQLIKNIKKTKNHVLILTCFLLLSSTLFAKTSSGIEISYAKGILSIQNDLIERKFKYDTSSQINFFFPVAWIDKNKRIEFHRQDNKDWFELCVDGTIIQSQDGGWDYENYEKRSLENGGIRS